MELSCEQLARWARITCWWRWPPRLLPALAAPWKPWASPRRASTRRWRGFGRASDLGSRRSGPAEGLCHKMRIKIIMAMDHNLWLHFGADEHPCTTRFDVHQGYRALSHSHILGRNTVARHFDESRWGGDTLQTMTSRVTNLRMSPECTQEDGVFKRTEKTGKHILLWLDHLQKQKG